MSVDLNLDLSASSEPLYIWISIWGTSVLLVLWRFNEGNGIFIVYPVIQVI